MKKIIIAITFAAMLSGIDAIAQNPFIRDQFTADPSARIFNGRVYVYPSHDIVAEEGQGRPDWFCMEDYHVFSSDNLVDWTDHGVIVSQYDVDWVDTTTFSMWAPDCIERDGKYYFYFPANPNSTVEGRGQRIGVAIADKPEGPYVPQPRPIPGVVGIDPNILIDNDGQAYIYWSMGNIYGAKLKDNMLELDSEITVISEMPEVGLKEGPWVFERNGKYYMTYPHVENNIERLEYAIGDNPLGPFTFTGVIMDESPLGCWTNHQSFIEYDDQWYLFYHQNEYSPHFDKNRSICIDSMFFNADGTIQKVVPTRRGVGLTDATREIQIDRYSDVSDSGVSTEFHDIDNTFLGWKTIFSSNNGWLQYNAVDFGRRNQRNVVIKALSPTGGTIQVGLDDGQVLAEVEVPEGNEWQEISTRVRGYKPGVHNLLVTLTNNSVVEVDWVKFSR